MREVGPDNPHYANIGKRVRLKEDVWLLGISLKDKPPVEFYRLMGGVGYSGREVVFRGRLKKSSTVQVTKVLTDDAILLSRMIYVGNVEEGDHAGKEVQIMLIEESDGRFVLNGDYFELVD
jgi:hypothetical protein